MTNQPVRKLRSHHRKTAIKMLPARRLKMPIKKLAKKIRASQTRRDIVLNTSGASGNISLGNGYVTYFWNRSIRANEFLRCFIRSGDVNGINVGFRPGEFQANFYPIESFQNSRNEWIAIFYNAGPAQTLSVYLVTKPQD